MVNEFLNKIPILPSSVCHAGIGQIMVERKWDMAPFSEQLIIQIVIYFLYWNDITYYAYKSTILGLSNHYIFLHVLLLLLYINSLNTDTGYKFHQKLF